MTQIRIKRVYEDFNKNDGYRVLVDKLWPRGVKKETLKLDMWDKDIAPSTELREWYHQDMENRWEEFEGHYLRELSSSDKAKDFISSVKKYGIVTLLYASKDQKHNHAVILKSYLDKQLNKRD